MDLATLKKEYSKYEKLHELPSFKDLNEAFEIEKIDYDSDCFLRVVRKTMMDKLVNSMSFFDMLLNPVQAPRIYFYFIKNMSLEDKKLIEKIYEVFGRLSLECMPLELDYSEKAEAKMIKKIFDGWNSVKSDFKSLLGRISLPVQSSSKKEKSYFG